jgi:hypothetical protein
MDDFEKEFEELSEKADSHKSAWQATLHDLDVIVEEHEENGWDAVRIAAQDCACEGRDTNDVEGRFGLSFVIADNHADPFLEAFEAGEFPKYEVYRGEANGRVFMIIEYLDPGTETAIVVAGNFWRRDANLMIEDALDEEKMYSHYHRLDGSHLGSFEHDGIEKFFPEAERVHGDQ